MHTLQGLQLLCLLILPNMKTFWIAAAAGWHNGFCSIDYIISECKLVPFFPGALATCQQLGNVKEVIKEGLKGLLGEV